MNFRCFITRYPLIGGVLVPVAIIMIINSVIFVRVMRRLGKSVKGRSVIDKTEKRQQLRRVQNAICIMLLMGSTWAIGYLILIRSAAEILQGVFTVLNSMQGYFIFMLYCVRQPQVRKIWREQFGCCLTRESTAKFTSSGGDRTDSTFKNSSGKLIPGGGNRQRRLYSNSEGFQPTSKWNSGFRPEIIDPTPPERVPRAVYDNVTDLRWFNIVWNFVFFMIVN